MRMSFSYGHSEGLGRGDDSLSLRGPDHDAPRTARKDTSFHLSHYLSIYGESAASLYHPRPKLRRMTDKLHITHAR